MGSFSDNTAGSAAERVTEFRKINARPWKNLPEDLSWLEYDHYHELRTARMRAISEGHSLTDLSMINSDIAPARFCLDKLSEAIVKPQNQRYSVARGVRKLREAFSHKYSYRFGVKLCAENEICVTNGTKDAIFHALRVLTAPGDKILMAAPTYPLFRSSALLNGLVPVYFRIDSDEDLMFSGLVEALRREKPRVLLLNFPNNPSGVIVSRDFYQKLLPIARSCNVFVVNDFVYGELGFRNQYLPSLLSVEGFKELAIETYSMSKAYSLPGWRIGAVLGNSDVINNISRLKTHTDYGAYLPLQFAAASTLSLESDLVGPVLQQYQLRCRLLSDELTAIGCKVSSPRAGACVWAELPDRFNGSDPALRLALDCLDRFKVLISPGGIFGADYSRYIRIAAIRSADELADIVKKISIVLNDQ